ncbi:MAG: hypothetical protein K2J31_00940, partial [Alistipes sp.]|nr:hypothetical protein [Alistipes sp.]
AVLVIGATVGLFFLLGPEEKQSLFYVNLVLALVLEGALLAALFVTQSGYNLQNIATSGTVFYGAAAVVCCMVFTLFCCTLMSTSSGIMPP